jgi:hypothetical protein
MRRSREKKDLVRNSRFQLFRGLINVSMKQSFLPDLALEFFLSLAALLLKMCKLKIEHVMLLRTGMESRRCVSCGG